ncbi:MAG: hypothetical protein IPK96_19730 [Flammeovirgaceae bacterium]|nr:hypothetical protein [Flammeovirgaceae bacterium]
METNQELQALLASIGLKEVMVEKDSMDPFNSELFIIYTPEEYLQSERKEMDEIYRIGEKVLLHKTSGLRIEYVTSESYFGDEYTYRLKSIFIITKRGEKLQVTETDFNHKIFTTSKGMISFSEVSLKRLP